MFATILFVAVLVAFMAALGRAATPRHERIPWTSWTARDLGANVLLGIRRFAEFSAAAGSRRSTPPWR